MTPVPVAAAKRALLSKTTAWWRTTDLTSWLASGVSRLLYCTLAAQTNRNVVSDSDAPLHRFARSTDAALKRNRVVAVSVSGCERRAGARQRLRWR